MTLLTPTEVADKYGFHPSHIRRLIREGVIKARKFGNYYAIEERSVKKLKRKRRTSSEMLLTKGD